LRYCFSSRRRHTRSKRDWSSDVCSSDLLSGSAQLAGGIGQMNAQIPALTSGVNQLANGGNQLASGLGQMNAQIPALTSGVNQLAKGGIQLAGGLGEVNTQVAK